MSLQPSSEENLNGAAIDGLAALLVLVQKLMPRGRSTQQWQQYHESAPTLVQPAFSHLQACANTVQDLRSKSSSPCALYVGDVTPISGSAGTHVVAGLYTLAEGQSGSGTETIVTPLVSVHQAEFSQLSAHSYADRVVDTNVYNVSFNSAYMHAADTTPPLKTSPSPYFDFTLARKLINTSAALISKSLDEIKDQKEQVEEGDGYALVLDPVLVRDILQPLKNTTTHRQYDKPSLLVGKKGVGKSLGLALAKFSDLRDVQTNDTQASQDEMEYVQHQPGVVACNSFARMINEDDSNPRMSNKVPPRMEFARRSTFSMLIYETKFPSTVVSGGMWHSHWQINCPKTPLRSLIQTSLTDKLNPSISYVPGFSISYGMDPVDESFAAQLKPRMRETMTLIGSVLATVLNRFFPETPVGLLVGLMGELVNSLTIHVGIVTGRPLLAEEGAESDLGKFAIDLVSPFRIVQGNEEQNINKQRADLKQAAAVIKAYEETSQGARRLTKSCRATFLLPTTSQLMKFLNTYQATLKKITKIARVASLVIDHEGSERYRIPIDLDAPINSPQTIEDKVELTYKRLHAGILALHTQYSEQTDYEVAQASRRLEGLEAKVVSLMSSTPPHEIIPATEVDERNSRQGEYLRKLAARVELLKAPSPAYSVLERELENVKKERAELLKRMAAERLESEETLHALEDREYASSLVLKQQLEKAEDAKRDLERSVEHLSVLLTESERGSESEKGTLVAQLTGARKSLEAQQARIEDLETRKMLCEQQLDAAKIHRLQADEAYESKLGDLQREIDTLQRRLDEITANPPYPGTGQPIPNPVPVPEPTEVPGPEQDDYMEVDEAVPAQPPLRREEPPQQLPQQRLTGGASSDAPKRGNFSSDREYYAAMKQWNEEERVRIKEAWERSKAAERAKEEHEAFLRREQKKKEKLEAPLTKDFPSSFDLVPSDAPTTANTSEKWEIQTLVMNGQLLDLAKDNLERNLVIHPEFQRLYLSRLIHPGQKVTQQNAIYRRTALLPTFYLRPRPEFPMLYGTETESTANGLNAIVNADNEMIDLHKEALERPDHEFGDFVHDTLDFAFLPVKYYVSPSTSVTQAKQGLRTKALLEQYGMIIYWSVIENLNSDRKWKGKAGDEREDVAPARAKKEKRNFARHTRAIVIYLRTDPNSPSTGNYLKALSEEYFVRTLYPVATQADPGSRQADTNLLRQTLKPILVPLPYDVTQPFACIAAYTRHFMYNITTFAHAKNRSLATLDGWMDARIKLATIFERTRVKDVVTKESDRIRDFFRKRGGGEPTSVQYELALLNLRKKYAEVRKGEKEKEKENEEARKARESQGAEGGASKPLTDPSKIINVLETTFGPDTRWQPYQYKGLFNPANKDDVGYFMEPVVTSYARLALERVRKHHTDIDIAAFTDRDVVICNGTYLKELIELGGSGEDPAQTLSKEATLLEKLFRQQGPYLDSSEVDGQREERTRQAKVVIFVMNEQIKEGLPEGQSWDEESDDYVPPYLINWLIVIINPSAFRAKALEPATAAIAPPPGTPELKCNILIIDPMMSPERGHRLTIDTYKDVRYDPDKHQPNLTAKQKEDEAKKTDAQREQALQNKRKKFATRASKMQQRMPYGILPQPPGMIPTVKIVNNLEPGEVSTPLINLPGGNKEITENNMNPYYHHRAWAAFALAALVRYRTYSPPGPGGKGGPPGQFVPLNHIIQAGERSSKPMRNELSGPKRRDGDSKDLIDVDDVRGFLPGRSKVLFMNKPLLKEQKHIEQLQRQFNEKKKTTAAAVVAAAAAVVTVAEEVVPTGGEVQQATVVNVGKGKKKGAKGGKTEPKGGDELTEAPKGIKELTVLKNFTIDQSGFRMLECLEFLLPRLRNTVAELDKPIGKKKATGIGAVLKEFGPKFLAENIWSTPLVPLQFIVDYDRVLMSMLGVLGAEVPPSLLTPPPQTKVAKKNSVLPAEVEDWQFTAKDIATEIESVRRKEDDDEEGEEEARNGTANVDSDASDGDDEGREDEIEEEGEKEKERTNRKEKKQEKEKKNKDSDIEPEGKMDIVLDTDSDDD